MYNVVRLIKRINAEEEKSSQLFTENFILNDRITKYRNDTFRVGDLVYTADKKFKYNYPYYITEIYGGLGAVCAIIHSDKNADRQKNGSCISYGVPLQSLSHDKFPTCPTCGEPSIE